MFPQKDFHDIIKFPFRENLISMIEWTSDIFKGTFIQWSFNIEAFLKRYPQLISKKIFCMSQQI
jgi:hypothetical protein